MGADIATVIAPKKSQAISRDYSRHRTPVHLDFLWIRSIKPSNDDRGGRKVESSAETVTGQLG